MTEATADHPIPARLAGLSFWLLAAGIAFVTLCPPHLRPQTGHAFDERAAAYMLLGVAAASAWPKTAWRGLVSVLAIAALLEVAQLLVPGRDAHVIDALQKMAGGAAGVGAVLAARGLSAWLGARSKLYTETAAERPGA